MKVLILANGDPPSAAFAQRLAGEHDLLLVTDGAAHKAARLGLAPNIISGDFDSVARTAMQARFPDADWVETPHQDRTDLEKAILLLLERGANTITILGATGGRWDHTLAAFVLAARYRSEAAICLRDDHTLCRAVGGNDVVPDTLTLRADPGDTISLLWQADRPHVTIRGVRWPLEDHPLSPETLGISNVAEEAQVWLSVRGGVLLAFHLSFAPPFTEDKKGDPTS